MSHAFGWCLDGLHADQPHGCPGQVGGPEGLTCSCPCHEKEG